MLVLISSVLALISTAAGIPVGSSAAACDLATLQAATDNYIAAQKAGKPATLTQLDSSATYTENDKSTAIASGILSQAIRIDHNKSLHDTTQCATYTELISTDSKHPYVIGTQMRFGNNSKITKVQTLVTDKGDWLFNATATLYWASRENWDPIPESKRDSRATIQAAADAYCDIFSNKSVVVPWGKPCDRLEGGMYTGTGSDSDSCDVGIPSGVNLADRRYVIDESLGTVDVFIKFAGNLPDSHEFRVENGKIRYVHTLTVMS
jgi:hypothetical protein